MDTARQLRLVESCEEARRWVHDANNALFIAKGFSEEISFVIKDDEFLKPDFDKADFLAMASKITDGLDRVGNHLQKLARFARTDVFEIVGMSDSVEKK